jgi:aminoglycoside phosphotransferase (APT) family kinase protein
VDERLAMKKPEVLRVVKCCLPAILFDDKRKKASEDASAINIDLQVDDLQVTTLCRLWAGMGLIYRVRISLPVGSTTSGNRTTGNDEIAIKHIIPPPSSKRSFGDHRKASSYHVEANFYENLAQELIAKGVSVPTPYHVERGKGDSVIIAMSYHESKVNPTENQQRVRLVLSWLAQFHAMYWDADAADRVVQQAGLQAVGSYWYLATRPDEHEEMPDHGWQGRLKRAARAIDARLQRDPLQCVIHGDAKDANILMDEHGKVTFCDFQYCGRGPPTRDLAYFFCSSVSIDDEKEALEYYWNELKARLPLNVSPAPTWEQLQDSMEFAYADFYRFMSGWGFWGSGAERRVIALLDRLDHGSKLATEEDYDEAVQREFG